MHQNFEARLPPTAVCSMQLALCVILFVTLQKSPQSPILALVSHTLIFCSRICQWMEVEQTPFIFLYCLAMQRVSTSDILFWRENCYSIYEKLNFRLIFGPKIIAFSFNQSNLWFKLNSKFGHFWRENCYCYALNSSFKPWNMALHVEIEKFRSFLFSFP